MTSDFISKDLCEFVGAVIGYGHLWTDGSRFKIGITGDPKLDRTYFEYLRTLSYKLFEKEPYKFTVSSGGLRFVLQSKSAFSVFLALGMEGGKKARTVVIPQMIVYKGWSYAKHTLRGIFDTDGTVFFSKKTYSSSTYPTIEICTYSVGLANQLTSMLVEQECGEVTIEAFMWHCMETRCSKNGLMK